MKDIEDFIGNLQSLIDSKSLLDNILLYYNIYDGSFRNEDLLNGEKHKDYAKLQTLNSKIRNYLKFDDSE